MESFRLVTDSGTEYAIRVQEIDEVRDDVLKTLIEIDLQTFSESTFSHYTAAAFLRNGRVFVLLNLIVDLLYHVVDPRLRVERGAAL